MLHVPKTSIQIRCLGEGMIVPDPWLKLRYSWSSMNRITLTADWTCVLIALSEFHCNSFFHLMRSLQLMQRSTTGLSVFSVSEECPLAQLINCFKIFFRKIILLYFFKKYSLFILSTKKVFLGH